MTTSDATTAFFERLGRRGHEPLFGAAAGSVRFELAHGKSTVHWLVSVDEGDVAVSHKRTKADCTVRTSKGVFERIVRGDVNAMTAVLRGLVVVEGDSKILVRFLRLFPGPAGR